MTEQEFRDYFFFNFHPGISWSQGTNSLTFNFDLGDLSEEAKNFINENCEGKIQFVVYEKWLYPAVYSLSTYSYNGDDIRLGQGCVYYAWLKCMLPSEDIDSSSFQQFRQKLFDTHRLDYIKTHSKTSSTGVFTVKTSTSSSSVTDEFWVNSGSEQFIVGDDSGGRGVEPFISYRQLSYSASKNNVGVCEIPTTSTGETMQVSTSYFRGLSDYLIKYNKRINGLEAKGRSFTVHNRSEFRFNFLVSARVFYKNDDDLNTVYLAAPQLSSYWTQTGGLWEQL